MIDGDELFMTLFQGKSDELPLAGDIDYDRSRAFKYWGEVMLECKALAQYLNRLEATDRALKEAVNPPKVFSDGSDAEPYLVFKAGT